jgi:hypothetical protein
VNSNPSLRLGAEDYYSAYRGSRGPRVAAKNTAATAANISRARKQTQIPNTINRRGMVVSVTGNIALDLTTGRQVGQPVSINPIPDRTTGGANSSHPQSDVPPNALVERLAGFS